MDLRNGVHESHESKPKRVVVTCPQQPDKTMHCGPCTITNLHLIVKSFAELSTAAKPTITYDGDGDARFAAIRQQHKAAVLALQHAYPASRAPVDV